MYQKLKKIKITGRKSVAVFFGLSAVMLGVLFFVEPVYAAFDLTTVTDGILNAVSKLILMIARLFIQMTIFFLKFFILVTGYNNYIDAPVVKLGWNMVRDVVNMFFIVILMAIAFGTILGIEQYEWRKTLVKLVIAAVLVNFSNMILQLMIDVVQVFTITFLNAIAATAGGNLIQLFSFDKVLEIALGGNGYQGERVDIEVFGASVMAIVIAGMAMMMILAYVVVALARMVALWTAMILSPLAFLLAVLPNTKSYGDQFWKEFFNYLVAAPIMVFFMWLAFATLGGESGAYGHLQTNHPLKANVDLTKIDEVTQAKPGVSLNAAGSWDNLANFAVALAFLYVGIDQVSKLGTMGSGMVSNAKEFGKKVGTIASGVAAGRWLGGKTVGVAKGIGKLAASIPMDRLKAEGYAAKAHMWSLGRRVAEGDPSMGGIQKFIGRGVRGYVDRQKRWKKMEGAAKMEESLVYTRTEAQTGMLMTYQFNERDRDGHEIKGLAHKDGKATVVIEQKHVYTDQDGNRVAAYNKEGRILKKEEVAALRNDDGTYNISPENRIDLSDLAGLPRDRFLEGVMQGEKKRKAEKDREFQSFGQQELLMGGRIKGGEQKKKKGTVADEIGKRGDRALEYEGTIKAALESAGSARIALDIQRETERKIARATADDYAAAGDIPRATAALRMFEDTWAKKDAEVFGSLNYAERMQTEAQLGRALKKVQDEIRHSGGTATREQAKLRDALIRQKTSLTTINNTADLESARDGLTVGLNTIGWADQSNPEDVELNEKNRVRAHLSRLLGRVVENNDGGMEEAMIEFNNAYGGDEARQAVMRQLLKSQKTAAMLGDTNNIGIVSEGVTRGKDDQPGELKLSFGSGNYYDHDTKKHVATWGVKEDPVTAETQKQSRQQTLDQDTLDYYAGRIKLNTVDEIGSLMTMGQVEVEVVDTDDSGQPKKDANGNDIKKKVKKLGVTGISNAQIQTVTSLFEGKNANTLATQVQSSLWKSINGIKIEGMDDAAKGNIEKLLRSIVDGFTDHNAKVLFQERTADLHRSLGIPLLPPRPPQNPSPTPQGGNP
ncbi:hypothetical protein KKG22_02495 [Patescibacteria group bacterium]|nr:hypothetical protein [Patescibacteria group bacterium]